MRINSLGGVELDPKDRRAYQTDWMAFELSDVTADGFLDPWRRYNELRDEIRGSERRGWWMSAAGALMSGFGMQNPLSSHIEQLNARREDLATVARVGGAVLVYEIEEFYGIPHKAAVEND